MSGSRVLLHNVTLATILKYCTVCEKMALRATCKWLASFIGKKKVTSDEIGVILCNGDLVRVFEASIEPKSVYIYSLCSWYRELVRDVIGADCLSGFLFIQQRFYDIDAWVNRTVEIDILKIALRQHAHSIVKCLLCVPMTNITSRVNVFWKIVYNGNTAILKWFIGAGILPLDFLKKCPVIDIGYLGRDCNDSFRSNIRYLLDIIDKSVFDELMIWHIDHFWSPNSVNIIAEERNYVPPQICQKLICSKSILMNKLHMSICKGHPKK
jgi:hypothetical protein